MFGNHSFLENNKPLHHQKYRADIDGLRAVAVISVVIYHAFPNILKGGFIGVDIFFVISGYLISSIILSHLAQDNFTFLEFYSRRIKRIFPALLLVLVTCLIFGWFVLLADEYKQLGKHVAGGAGFISNFLFWSESGYFDHAAETKPLLHLWSLGIEEQFYIVWPFLLWGLWNKKWNMFYGFTALTITSFALNVIATEHNQIAAFYSPLTRFWELLVGSILALSNLNSLATPYQSFNKLKTLQKHSSFAEAISINRMSLNNAVSLIGLILITASLILIDKSKSFPGWWATLPVAGAICVIYAGNQAWLNRIVLSNPILVWIGLISFPLYLWHWPILSFAQILLGEPLTLKIKLIAIAFATLFAFLTYHFVEKPIRFGARRDKQVLLLMAFMMSILCSGYYIYKHHGFNARPIQQNLSATFEYQYHWTGWGQCDFVKISNPDNGGCKILKKDKPVEVVVIGDSHAGHLADGIKDFFTPRKENVAIMLYAGCYPLTPIKVNDEDYFNCSDSLIENAIHYAESTKSVKLVILSGYAALHIQKNRHHEAISVDDRVIKNNIHAFSLGLDKTLQQLIKANKKVVYITDTPELLKDPVSCIKRNIIPINKVCDVDIEKEEYLERNKTYHGLIRLKKEQYNSVYFVDTEQMFCDDKKCYGVKNDLLLYQSRDHLTPHGSKYLFRAISRQLNELLE